MSASNFRLDRRGVAEVLRSEGVAKLANEAADQLADRLGEGAKVQRYTTDRKAASVSIPAEQQARDGALTRAAAAVGLQVRAR